MKKQLCKYNVQLLFSRSIRHQSFACESLSERKKKEAFTEEHPRSITFYEAANRYLKGVMNGDNVLPATTWDKERDDLTAERSKLNREYVSGCIFKKCGVK